MASGKPARVSDGSRGHAEPGDGARLDVHASTLVVGEHGVLVRGPSGSGKTRLVLALMAEAGRDAFARLVADDRTLLSRHAGRIVARPHPAIAGLVERRGLGIVTVPSEPACRVSLVVDLVVGPWPPRMPDPRDDATTLAGIALPRLAVASRTSTPDAVALILTKLATLTTSS